MKARRSHTTRRSKEASGREASHLEHFLGSPPAARVSKKKGWSEGWWVGNFPPARRSTAGGQPKEFLVISMPSALLSCYYYDSSPLIEQPTRISSSARNHILSLYFLPIIFVEHQERKRSSSYNILLLLL